MLSHLTSGLGRSGLVLFGAILALAVAAAPAAADDPVPVVTDVRAAAPDAPAAVICKTPAPGPACGPWSIALEGGISLFDDPEGIIGETPPAGVTSFDWGANDYESAFGFRATVGYRLRSGDRIEARGTYLGSWDDESRQTGQFGFRPTPGGGLVLSPPATADLIAETDVWGGELNWWRNLCCQPRWQLDWGLGVRYLRIEDEVEASNWAGRAPNSFLSAEVENTFLGAQLMGAARMRPTSKFEFGLTVKALLGWMSKDMSESDTSIVTGGPTGNASEEETDFSFGIEADVSLMYRVLPRIGVTASYTLLYLDDLARAGNVLDFSRSATGSLQLAGTAESTVIHSLFLGIRIDL